MVCIKSSMGNNAFLTFLFLATAGEIGCRLVENRMADHAPCRQALPGTWRHPPGNRLHAFAILFKFITDSLVLSSG